MKKLLLFFVVLAFLVFGFSACSNDNADEGQTIETPTPPAVTQTENEAEEEQTPSAEVSDWVRPSEEAFAQTIIQAEQTLEGLFIPGHFIRAHSEEVGDQLTRRVLPSAGFDSIAGLREVLTAANLSAQMIDSFLESPSYEERGGNLYFFPYIAGITANIWDHANFSIVESSGTNTIVEAREIRNFAEGMATRTTVRFHFHYNSIVMREHVDWSEITPEDLGLFGRWSFVSVVLDDGSETPWEIGATNIQMELTSHPSGALLQISWSEGGSAEQMEAVLQNSWSLGFFGAHPLAQEHFISLDYDTTGSSQMRLTGFFDGVTILFQKVN